MKFKQYAPVLICTLNRINHLRTTIESLKRCALAEYTDVYIGLDYPPSKEYEQGYKAVCNYLENENHTEFKSFNIIKRETNFGSFKNSRELKNYILERYDSFIRMEDDIEVSCNFLIYMNSALDYYEKDENVIAISGYSYPVNWTHDGDDNSIKSNFIASVWGIGFWKKKYLELENNIRNGYMFHEFKSAYIQGKINKMSDACILDYASAYLAYIKFKKKIPENSFFCNISDICLRAYLMVAEKYVIMPIVSHTRNHGFDGSGEICQAIDVNLNEECYADNYDYDNQPIDNTDDYIFLPANNDYLDNNRDKYNSFDRRNKDEVRQLLHEVKMTTYFGSIPYRLSYIGKSYFKAGVKRIKYIIRH